jgi:O-antigen ligase
VLGVGTNSTRYLDRARQTRDSVKLNNYVVPLETRAHPHNVYLQIWYELGAIGVFTFAYMCLSFFSRISLLGESKRFGLAQFAVCGAAIAPSYGFWQNWFQSAIVLSILVLVLVALGSASRLERSSA